MNHTRLLFAAAIIGLLLIIGFVLSVPHTSEVTETFSAQHDTLVPSVDLHDSFKKGVHTITGSLEVPNACASVTADATLVDASNTQNILVTLSLVPDSEMCLEIPTDVRFSTTITAPANLPIQATVNGSVASTTLL